MGLIEDDDEWIRAMNEAITWMIPGSLRKLFVRILIHCQPINPHELWQKFKIPMSENYARNIESISAIKKAYSTINHLLTLEDKVLLTFQK